MIKQLKDYFIFGSPILVALGFLNMYIYYKFFNVPIQDYLEITEIITSFLDESILGAIAAGVGAILMTRFNFKRDMALEEHESIPMSKKERTIQTVMIVFTTVAFIGILIYYLVLPSIKRWHEPYYMESFYTGLTIFLVWLVSLIYDFEQYRLNHTNSHAKYIFIGAFLTFLPLLGFLQIRSVKYNHGTIGTEVKYYEDERCVNFLSDSTSYFIGKTRNFVFIFHSENETTLVIPIQNVDQIVLNVKSINPFTSGNK